MLRQVKSINKPHNFPMMYLINFFQSVSLARGRFMTVNGDIEGTFNATINLGLYSHDGAIRADVGLSHVDEFPRLYARTDNGFVIHFAFSIH